MKSVVHLTLAVLFLVLTACSKSSQEEVIRPTGTIVTNGPGADGSVHANTKIFFVLKNVNKGQLYTLRTAIGQKLGPDGIPIVDRTLIVDGTLSVAIYQNQDDYVNSAPTVTSAVPALPPYDYIYEANFSAPSSGDYLAVLSGESISAPGIQFFYDLRLMSADQSVLTSFPTGTAIPAHSGDTLIGPGFLNIFSGSSITSQGTYLINLTSNSTTTFGYPQLFVYRDDTLRLGSLLYSSFTTSMDFIVTKFDIATGISSTLPTDPNNTLASGMTITNIVFSDRGPFIVVKGIISASTYSLTIGSVTAGP